MPVNKAVINKTINLIKSASANKILMAYWFTDGKGTEVPKNQFNPHKCKTTACIAGWIVSANKTAAKKTGFVFTPSQAGILLGIEYYQSIELFHYFEVDNLTPNRRKKAVIKVLEILRDTGEVNWVKALK